LVRAGLLPAIRDDYLDAEWQIAKFRPGAHPLDSLAWALSSGDPAGVRRMLESSSMGLVRAVQMLQRSATHILILVDQFEELFQFVQRNGEMAQEETKAFLKLLLAGAASDAASIYVVITMRLEWLSESASYAGLTEAINEGLYLVPPMSRRQFEQSIVGPVEKAGGVLTSALLDRMLNDLEGRTDQLPILQHALMRMWQKRPAPAPLDLDTYNAVGGFANCLELHAEKVYQKQFDDWGRCAVEGLFRSITQVSKGRKVRRPRSLGEIADYTGLRIGVLEDVVKKFGRPGRSFLVTTPGKLGENSIIDIAHEALIRQWTRLRKWVDSEADVEAKVERLEAVAAEWDQGQRKLNSLLYRGSVLEAAEEWKPRIRAGGPAMPFLEASRRAEFWSKVWRNGLPGLALLSLCSLIALGVVMHAKSDSEREAKIAKTAEKAAKSAELEQRNIAASYAEAIRELKRQIAYQASLKTLAESQTDSTNPSSTAPIIRAIDAKRVYLQYGESNQAALAIALKKALTKQHYNVPDIEHIGSRAPNQTEVHYFNAEDKQSAEAIKSVLGGLVTGAVDGKQIVNRSNIVPKGQFEVWLAKDASARTQPINLQLEMIRVINPGPPGGRHNWQLEVTVRMGGNIEGRWPWNQITLDKDTKVATPAKNLANEDIEIEITGRSLGERKNFDIRGRGHIGSNQLDADIRADAVDQKGTPKPGQGSFAFVFKKVP
jgi:hypothetical protein